jgi:hypothetical protein
MLSKTLLAGLPRAQLRKLYENHAEEAAATPFATDWDTLLENLKAIRTEGYATTQGELDPGLVGLAVPVASRAESVLAALGLVMTQQRHATTDVSRTVGLLQGAAERILAALAAGAGRDAPAASGEGDAASARVVVERASRSGSGRRKAVPAGSAKGTKGVSAGKAARR